MPVAVFPVVMSLVPDVLKCQSDFMHIIHHRIIFRRGGVLGAYGDVKLRQARSFLQMFFQHIQVIRRRIPKLRGGPEGCP